MFIWTTGSLLISVNPWMPFDTEIIGPRNWLPTSKSSFWQDNTATQTWLSLEDFGNQADHKTFSLGTGEAVIENHYQDSDFERFGKTYQTFNNELYQGKVNQVTIDLPVTEDLHTQWSLLN